MPSIQTAAWFVAMNLLVATAAFAAGSVSRADAQAAYAADRAACMRGDTGQERSACLKEAAAARQEALRGGLNDGQADYGRNQRLRCNSQPAEDRPDCLRRMNGEGTISGSVQDGGILRELATPVSNPQVNQ